MVTKEQLERDAEKPVSLLIKDPAALERLASALADGDAATRDIAASVLRRVQGRGRWTDAAQVDLVRAVSVELPPAVRSAALASLRRCASPLLAGPALRLAIVDADGGVRELADAILRVRGFVRGWSEEVQRWAMESTGDARCAALDAYTVPHSDDADAPGWAWLVPWLDSDDQALFLAVAGALAEALEHRNPSERPVHPRFISGLRSVVEKHAHPVRRAAAAVCLTDSTDLDSTRSLVEAMASDASGNVRHAACRALLRHPLPFETARDLVLRQLPFFREHAPDHHSDAFHDLFALLSPHTEATECVIEALAREPASRATIAMLGWLGERTCAASLEVVAAWVRTSPEQLDARCGPLAGRHREAAIVAAAARRSAAADLVPALLVCLGHPQRDTPEPDPVTGTPHHAPVEFAIVEALADIGVTSSDVRAALHAVHLRGGEYVRRAVLAALGKLGADDDLTVDLLLEGLTATDPYTFRVARDALVELGAPLVARLEERRRDPATSGVAARALQFIVPSPEDAVNASLMTERLRADLLRSGTSDALALTLLAPSGAANRVVSPLSVALMLRFLGEVAGGATRAALPTWLQDREAFHSLGRAVDHLRAATALEFRASMAVFPDVATPLHAEFERRFDGHLERVPLNESEALAHINRWAEAESRGLLPALLSDLPPETRLVLIQLTYFSGLWMSPLTDGAPGDTMSFHTAQRAWRQVARMSGTVECRIAGGTDYEAIELPYQPGTTALLLVMPAEGTFQRFRERLDATELAAIVQALDDTVVALRMPRFSVKSELQSPELLRVLGLEQLFQSTDLSGMTPLREAGAHLELFHAAHLRAHELGTDAAAATSAYHIGGALPRVLTVDRPFLFFLRHRETGVVLFAGQITDPVDA